MNRDVVGFLVSVGLLFFGYVAINRYYASQKAPESQVALVSPSPTVAAIATAIATAMPQVAAAPAVPGGPAPTPAVPDEIQRLSNPPQAAQADLRGAYDLMDIDFTQTGGCLGTVRLIKYQAQAGGADPAELHDNYNVCKLLGSRIGNTDLRTMPSLVERVSANAIRFSQTANGFTIVKTLDFSPGDYRANMTVQVKNVTGGPQNSMYAFELGATSEKKKSGGFFSRQPQEFPEAAIEIDGKLTRKPLPYKDDPHREDLIHETGIVPEWVETGSLYFAAAALPRSKEPLNFNVFSTGYNIQKNRATPADRTVYESWVEHPFQLEAGASKEWQYELYLGPKIKGYLDKFDGRNLSHIIDYGFFSIVAWPIYYALSKLHALVGNWGIAIIILTVGLKLLFFPLTLRAYIAGKKMQKMQPQMNALKEKYKDDKQKQSQEMMALMAQSGSNPMSGCLPVLPQIPVFFALFSVLQHTFELRHAPFGLWIKDLSAMDPLYITPIALAIVMFVQQKITPPAPSMDPAQAKMMQYLPIVFAIFMLSFPSGLVMYSLTNAAITLVQQQYMMRKYKDL